MGMVRLSTVVLVMIAAPVFAASVVTYELQLNGDNHAADIQAGTRTVYTAGNAVDGVVVGQPTLNWAAALTVDGVHSQPGHPSDGLATQGVANFVFNLELRSGSAAGPLVSTISYFSSIHSGAGALDCSDCAGGYVIPGPTPFCSGAAFAYSFKIVPSWGAGTVLEALRSTAPTYSGPFMEVGMYPTVDVGNTSGEGQLLGMGAGYGQWSRGGGLATMTTRGVGLISGAGALGKLPLVEGQIDISQLAAGTYVLKLTPGTGHNVLRGDVDLVTAPQAGNPEVQAFAVPANQAVGDTITFLIDEAPPACDELTVVSSVSRKPHGTSGAFDLASGSTEGRINGVTQIVTTFDKDIQRATETQFDVQVSSGTVGTITAVGQVLTVNITGVSNQTLFTISYPGIVAVCDDNITSETVNCWRVLYGDVNASGSVNNTDIVNVRGQLGKTVSGTCAP